MKRLIFFCLFIALGRMFGDLTVNQYFGVIFLSLAISISQFNKGLNEYLDREDSK